MTSIVLGPFAIFDRPLRDEEPETLYRLAEWSISMDLAEGRDTAELTNASLWRKRDNRPTAPKMAHRYARRYHG